MKTKERKQKDLNALTEQLSNSKSAMIVSFNKLTVNKDQEFRHQLREVGAKYQVVKNTIARLAVKGTPYEGAGAHFKGVTGIVWSENDPVVLSKTVSTFIKANADFYTFKAGVVDGRVVDLAQVQAIAGLPSKEVLISQLLYVINAQAQRIVTVINAVPRDLAVVIKQIGEAKPEVAAELKAEEPQVEELKAEETPAAEAEETPAAEVEETPAAEAEGTPAAEAEETPAAEAEETPAAEAEETPAAEAEETPEPVAETVETLHDAPAVEESPALESSPEAESAPEAEASEEKPE